MARYLFAYASLVPGARSAREHHLRGYRRRWGVAMDNRVDLAGYKYYTDLDTGGRPSVYVSFLDLAGDPAAEVNGALLPVTDERLAALDARERNYRRVDVSEVIEPPADAPVLTYVGTDAGRARRRHGDADGSCVVDAAYLDAVRAGFARLGDAALRRFEATTDPPGCPVVPLRRHDLPGR